MSPRRWTASRIAQGPVPSLADRGDIVRLVLTLRSRRASLGSDRDDAVARDRHWPTGDRTVREVRLGRCCGGHNQPRGSGRADRSQPVVPRVNCPPEAIGDVPPWWARVGLRRLRGCAPRCPRRRSGPAPAPPCNRGGSAVPPSPRRADSSPHPRCMRVDSGEGRSPLEEAGPPSVRRERTTPVNRKTLRWRHPTFGGFGAHAG